MIPFSLRAGELDLDEHLAGLGPLEPHRLHLEGLARPERHRRLDVQPASPPSLATLAERMFASPAPRGKRRRTRGEPDERPQGPTPPLLHERDGPLTLQDGA